MASLGPEPIPIGTRGDMTLGVHERTNGRILEAQTVPILQFPVESVKVWGR